MYRPCSFLLYNSVKIRSQKKSRNGKQMQHNAFKCQNNGAMCWFFIKFYQTISVKFQRLRLLWTNHVHKYLNLHLFCSFKIRFCFITCFALYNVAEAKLTWKKVSKFRGPNFTNLTRFLYKLHLTRDLTPYVTHTLAHNARVHWRVCASDYYYHSAARIALFWKKTHFCVVRAHAIAAGWGLFAHQFPWNCDFTPSSFFFYGVCTKLFRYGPVTVSRIFDFEQWNFVISFFIYIKITIKSIQQLLYTIRAI